MNQYSQYLRWMKSKHILNSQFQASSMNSLSNSWEEEAFAEDAAGPLGGFIWPPRSYSCSFCRREFKSAQALGGHMNVHRRDRARLKQSLISPHSEVLVLHHHHHQNHNQQHPSKSLDVPYPSQVYTLNPNPNPNNCNPSATQENFTDHTAYVSPFSIVHEEHLPYSSETAVSISDSKTKLEKNPRIEEPDHNVVETNLSVGLNNEAVSCKRHKTTVPFFFLKPYFQQSEVVSSMEDLDLELRLGDPPKVK